MYIGIFLTEVHDSLIGHTPPSTSMCLFLHIGDPCESPCVWPQTIIHERLLLHIHIMLSGSCFVSLKVIHSKMCRTPMELQLSCKEKVIPPSIKQL